MWNKIKWVVIGVSLGWLLYLNYTIADIKKGGIIGLVVTEIFWNILSPAQIQIDKIMKQAKI